MVHHYYRNVNAVVFVYDVTNSQSFEVYLKSICFFFLLVVAFILLLF